MTPYQSCNTLNDSFKYDIYFEYSWVVFCFFWHKTHPLRHPSSTADRHCTRTAEDETGKVLVQTDSQCSLWLTFPTWSSWGEERPSLTEYVRMSGKSAFLSGLNTVVTHHSHLQAHTALPVSDQTLYHDIRSPFLPHKKEKYLVNHNDEIKSHNYDIKSQTSMLYVWLFMS